jgi:hypothetical protein
MNFVSTPKRFVTSFVGSASTGNGSECFSAKAFFDSTSSTLMPRICAFTLRNAKMLSRSSQAWVVQPGVSSFG